jgi:hypothetical protein
VDLPNTSLKHYRYVSLFRLSCRCRRKRQAFGAYLAISRQEKIEDFPIMQVPYRRKVVAKFPVLVLARVLVKHDRTVIS